jgi:hypothetical protein
MASDIHTGAGKLRPFNSLHRTGEKTEPAKREREDSKVRPGGNTYFEVCFDRFTESSRPASGNKLLAQIAPERRKKTPEKCLTGIGLLVKSSRHEAQPSLPVLL